MTSTIVMNSRMRSRTAFAKESSVTTPELPARTELAHDLRDQKPSYHLIQRCKEIYVRYMEDRT